MELKIPSFPDGGPIPTEFALCAPAEEGHVTMAQNRSPHIQWNDPPEGTKSLVLLCHDRDAPTVPDDVNKEGKTIPPDLPRADFYHWVLVDISPAIKELPVGQDSDGVTPHGKPMGHTSHGVRGRNDYTSWFASDPDMAGDYGGYDGPCPPWNDERLHHYRFALYALDVELLNLDQPFGGAVARAAMEGHVLAKAEYEGTYTLNPALM